MDEETKNDDAREKHIEEATKAVLKKERYNTRILEFILKEEGDIGQEFLRIELRRSQKLERTSMVGDIMVRALSHMVADGYVDALKIERKHLED